jgi:O-antigen biosynthesis protein
MTGGGLRVDLIAASDSLVGIQASRLEGVAVATRPPAAGPAAPGDAPLVAVIDPDARLVPEGLLAAVRLLEREDDLLAVLTSERHASPDGERELRRSRWSPTEARAWSVASGLVVLRRSLIDTLGGLRHEAGWDGVHDLLLRAGDGARVATLVEVGCVREGPLGPQRARRSVAGILGADLDRRRVDGWIAGSRRAAGAYRVRRRFTSRPVVSVIIPTRDRPDLVEMALDGLARTRWRPLEAVFVDNGTLDPIALARLHRSPHRVVLADIPFRYTELVNRGAAVARGEILVLLNNDIEVRDPDWLEALVEHAVRPEVGPVGALLRYPLGSIQHCGIAIGPQGPTHPLSGCDDVDVPANLFAVPRDCTAVTAACLAIRADVYRQLGGLGELLERSYSGVDLCLRAWRHGFRCVYTPDAELIHHEGATRGHEVTSGIAADQLLFRSRWADVLAAPDPWWPEGVDLDTGLPVYSPGLAVSTA